MEAEAVGLRLCGLSSCSKGKRGGWLLYNTMEYNASRGIETPPSTSLQAYFEAHGRSIHCKPYNQTNK